ncbi:MAG TPA: penicillin acylase family protein, partial [Saprospiraceae bacterium]|nr:penicillin acylase family protein [Saprospiraceae bacterium]
MKKLFRILGVLMLLVAMAIGGFWFYLRSTGPQYSGTIDLEGVTSPVEVHYDDYGIPHIYAQNAQDAYHALGYAHAQDRLFQMEMIRRLVSGRLSELLGPAALKSDRMFLNLRLR